MLLQDIEECRANIRGDGNLSAQNSFRKNAGNIRIGWVDGNNLA